MYIRLVNQRPSDMPVVRHTIKVASIDAATFTDAGPDGYASEPCCDLIVRGQHIRIWGDHRATVELALASQTPPP